MSATVPTGFILKILLKPEADIDAFFDAWIAEIEAHNLECGGGGGKPGEPLVFHVHATEGPEVESPYRDATFADLEVCRDWLDKRTDVERYSNSTISLEPAEPGGF